MVILRQKTYTRAEQEAMSEIKNWLYGQGKRGIKIRNAREFLNARNLANTTADALRYQKMPELKGNEQQILQSLGLNKTAKAYGGIIRKHTNPELLDRWQRIYGSHFKNRIGKNPLLDSNDLKSLLDENRNTKKEINRDRKHIGSIRKKQIFVKSLLDKYGSLDKVGEVRGWTDEQRRNAEHLLEFTPSQFKGANKEIQGRLRSLRFNQDTYRVNLEKANRRKKQDALWEARSDREDWMSAYKASNETYKKHNKLTESFPQRSQSFYKAVSNAQKRVPVGWGEENVFSKTYTYPISLNSNDVDKCEIKNRKICIDPNKATVGAILHENGHASSSFLRPDLVIKDGINKKKFNTATYLDNTAAEDILASRNRFANNLDQLAEEGRATYGALAKARQMGLPRKERKQIRQELSTAFGTYSTEAAKDLIGDEAQLYVIKNL